MLEEAKESMSKMKMFGMLKTLGLRLSEAQESGWSYTDLLTALILDEKSYRAQKSTEYKIKRAKFRSLSSFDQFDYHAKRNLKKSQIEELKQLSFLKNKQNLLLLGPTGVGKTFIATALGHHACYEGYTCQFIGINLFIEQAVLNRTAGTFLKFRDRMIRPDLLILDDLGIKVLGPTGTQDLYDILEERYQNKSTIITSQLPIANWKEVIEDEVALEAILDRVGCGQRLEIIGDSFRKKFGVDITKGDQ